jgi:hypothetical protein
MVSHLFFSQLTLLALVRLFVLLLYGLTAVTVSKPTVALYTQYFRHL